MWNLSTYAFFLIFHQNTLHSNKFVIAFVSSLENFTVIKKIEKLAGISSFNENFLTRMCLDQFLPLFRICQTHHSKESYLYRTKFLLANNFMRNAKDFRKFPNILKYISSLFRECCSSASSVPLVVVQTFVMTWLLYFSCSEAEVW